MRAILLLLAGCLAASAYNPYPDPTLNPGDAVKFESLAALTYLQGKAPAVSEQGKVYIIDCWATWCEPCKTTIPLLNKLHNDYQPKGLRVIGVSVFGEDRSKVEAYLKANGGAMSYPVAISEKDDAFDAEWLKAADLCSLPNAFIVKDGKLLFIIHPGKITPQIVEALLAGGDQETAMLKVFQPVVSDEEKAAIEEAARSKRVSLLLRDAPPMEDRAGTVAYMDKILAENPKLPPEDKQEFLLLKVIYLDRKNVAEAIRILDQAKALAPNSKTYRKLDEARQMFNTGKP